MLLGFEKKKLIKWNNISTLEMWVNCSIDIHSETDFSCWSSYILKGTIAFHVQNIFIYLLKYVVTSHCKMVDNWKWGCWVHDFQEIRFSRRKKFPVLWLMKNFFTQTFLFSNDSAFVTLDMFASGGPIIGFQRRCRPTYPTFVLYPYW